MPPSLDELLGQFRGLLDAHRPKAALARAGEGNLRCEGCAECNRCRFCVQCVRCDDCSNCEQCHDCRGCTKSKLCRFCARSGFLEFCEGCEDSQYLVLCVDCKGCTQCFACVGLENAEFHVLNQRYTRKDYFPVVRALKKRLEEAIAAGTVLPELAAASRGLWPPRATSAPGATEVAGPAVAEPAEPTEPEVEPWAEDAAPVRSPGTPVAEAHAGASWAVHPPRPRDV